MPGAAQPVGLHFPMDWQIKTSSRKSTFTGESFNPGDRVVSLVFTDNVSGEPERADLHESEMGGFELPGNVLGRWVRAIKAPEDEAASVRERVESAEDFFFSLFDNEQPEAREISDMLKHLLALMLERKRVLRAVGARQLSGEQLYRHVKTKQEIAVPIAEMSHRLMPKIKDTLGDVML